MQRILEVGGITNRWAAGADPPEGQAGHAQGLVRFLCASQHVPEALSSHLCQAGHWRRHKLELLPVEGGEAVGKRFVIYSLAGCFMQVWKRRRCGGVRCSLRVVPRCCTRLVGKQPTLQLQQMHVQPTPAAQFGQWCAGIAYLELILMLVVDLRAGDSTWVSSASTAWRRLSFTMYWLLLVGCHWTPNIFKKEKQEE